MTETNTTTTTSTSTTTSTPTTSAKFYPDPDTLKKILPSTSKESFTKWIPELLQGCGAAGLTSKNQLIAILATAMAEVGPVMKPIKEYGGGGSAYLVGGRNYCGRGWIQLTHHYNYRDAGKSLNLPLYENPDLVLQQDIAIKTFLWFWTGGRPNAEKVTPYAEKGDWQNVRSVVNRGSSGQWNSTTKSGRAPFMKVVELGLKYLQGGIQGDFPPATNREGIADADTGSGGTLNLTGSGNPGSMGDAIAVALGVYNALNAHSHKFKGYMLPASFPELLKLEAQSSFNAVNFGDGLDGEYIVDEITFYGPHSQDVKGSYKGEGLEMEVVAFRPDPNAPSPQVFRGNTDTPLVEGSASGPAPTGDIPNRIYQAGIANKGKTTRDSPPACEGGNKACAYAVNKFCIIPAGLPPMGAGSSVGSLAVAGILDALKSGRGQKVPLDQVVPGDIWADARGNRHIGIFSAAGGKKVLSNSSSKAAFSWEDSIETVSRYYGGGLGDNFWRVLK